MQLRRLWSQTLSLSFLSCEITATELTSLVFVRIVLATVGKMLNLCLAHMFCVFAIVDFLALHELQALAPFPSRLRNWGLNEST